MSRCALSGAFEVRYKMYGCYRLVHDDPCQPAPVRILFGLVGEERFHTVQLTGGFQDAFGIGVIGAEVKVYDAGWGLVKPEARRKLVPQSRPTQGSSS